jgi:hypothetical protein
MLEKILSFIVEYKDIIIALIGLIFWAISNKKEFEKRLTEGMLRAKDLAKDKILLSAKEQENYIVENIATIVGKRFAIVLKFINEDTLRKITHVLYEKAMDKYDDGEINGSFKKESK